MMLLRQSLFCVCALIALNTSVNAQTPPVQNPPTTTTPNKVTPPPATTQSPSAQTPAVTPPSSTMTPGMKASKPGKMSKSMRSSKSMACSAEADKKSLHGPARKKYRKACKKGKMPMPM
jgi:hypothetical protein